MPRSEPAKHGNPHLHLIIRATNGSPWETNKFKEHDTVEEVTRKAVQHFVKDHVMEAGEYDLVLVVDSVAGEPLHPASRLEDVDIDNGAVLALMTHKPQVDG